MDRPPGTQERIALAEVEARLRKLRMRFNLYTAQHQCYGIGTVLALGFALLTFLAFSLSSFWFTLIVWPLLICAGFVCFRLLRQGMVDWTNLNTAARRVDLQAGLKQRLSTLAAQITAGAPDTLPASRLWKYLLDDNMNRLSAWEVKKVAPRRVPWSLLPFLAALLLAFFVASIPLLSPASEPVPFSLTNLELVTSELPERAGQLVDERMSMLPEEQLGPTMDPLPTGETMAQQAERQDGDQAGDQDQAEGEGGLGQELADLASLPEDIQQALRSALQGLQESDDKQQGQAESEERLALNDQQFGEQSAQSQQQAGGAEQQAVGEGQGEQDGESASQGKGSTKPPEQGSGLQKLKQARLDRRKTAGAFQSANPQLPSRGGQAGKGGTGAGTGTDRRLYGNEANLGAEPQTFSLSLDASFEKSHTGREIVKDEGGGVIIKSTSQLSENQALDDAIRNAQIPPEYEDIVKRLFSRGEMQ